MELFCDIETVLTLNWVALHIAKYNIYTYPVM